MQVYSALTGLQFQVGMRRGEVLSILDSILMKFAQVFVIQTHISFVNVRKDLYRHWAAQMEVLCRRTELVTPYEVLLRTYWEYWLLFQTSSYEVDADKSL